MYMYILINSVTFIVSPCKFFGQLLWLKNVVFYVGDIYWTLLYYVSNILTYFVVFYSILFHISYFKRWEIFLFNEMPMSHFRT